jgi:large subunit ribosomal protein L1
MAKKQSADPDQVQPAEGASQTKEAKPQEKEGKPQKPRLPKAPKPAAEHAPTQGTKPATPEAPKAPKAAAASADAGKKKKKPGVPPARGKKLRNHIKNAYAKIHKEGAVPLTKAVSLLKQAKRVKFDETVEIHMSLGIDSTQSDQMIRGSVPLPHGVGKTVRVLVFCQGDNVAKAKDAGADFAGGDDVIEKIQKQSWMDFDVALATQDMMGKVSRLGKVLGPRGLMPTPKAGTVLTAGQDVAAAVREFKAGKVEYRSDKGGNVHAGVGKMSFDDDKLADNITAFVEQIRAVKPSGVKGHYVRSITIAGSMTPGVPVSM